jgi:LPS-assembly lipoprotein
MTTRRQVLARGTQAATALGAASLVLLVQGCGFKLRGATNMNFTTLYTNFPQNSPVGADFRRILRSQADVALVDEAAKGQLRLIVLNDNREREIVGYSATGRPREYQLRQVLRYQLQDRKADPLGDPVQIIVRRDISTSDAEINAKQQEEELLYKEMQSDIVEQLIRRLSAARPPA